jgi:hypothetical protein
LLTTGLATAVRANIEQCQLWGVDRPAYVISGLRVLTLAV